MKLTKTMAYSLCYKAFRAFESHFSKCYVASPHPMRTGSCLSVPKHLLGSHNLLNLSYIFKSFISLARERAIASVSYSSFFNPPAFFISVANDKLFMQFYFFFITVCQVLLGFSRCHFPPLSVSKVIKWNRVWTHVYRYSQYPLLNIWFTRMTIHHWILMNMDSLHPVLFGCSLKLQFCNTIFDQVNSFALPHVNVMSCSGRTEGLYAQYLKMPLQAFKSFMMHCPVSKKYPVQCLPRR